MPRLDFVSEEEECPRCGGRLTVYKSRTRTVITLAQGKFEAREVLKSCGSNRRCGAVGSRELRRLVPPGQRYGYDLIVHVGLARYIGGRQRGEIRAELRDIYGIELSDGTVSNLCDRFLQQFERLHLQRVPALRAAMEGGYPLHLDATCEGGRGGLFVALDGWRGWVLGSKRIPTEHQEHVKPQVDQVVAQFGDPVAVVRDLGEGIGAAVEPLRQRGVPDLACHYHFLRAVGRKLLEQPYRLLKNALQRTGVRTKLRALLRDLRRHRQDNGGQRKFGRGPIREELLALVLWLLEGDGHKGPPFPFSLPYVQLVRRCRQMAEQADAWVPSPRTAAERRALKHLRSLLASLDKEQDIRVAIERLDEGWKAFCNLRDILRLTGAELPCADLPAQQPHPPSEELIRLAEIERNLREYKQKLENRVAANGTSSVDGVVLSYLQRYGALLFGHPTLRDQDGRVLAVVARTNNVLEQFFGRRKQELRRRLGRAHLARDLEQQPAQAALVANLWHPEYVRVLCGSLDHLPEAFGALDSSAITGATPLVRDHRDHRLHRQIKRLMQSATTTPDHGATATQANPTSPSTGDVPLPILDNEEHPEEVLRARCAAVFTPPRDPRLPPPGTVLTRTWDGTEHRVRILERGFEYQGQIYTRLTAITRTITGGRRTSGIHFFHLDRLRAGGESKAAPPPPKPSYPLDSFSKRFQDDLAQANYSEGTIRQYLAHAQRYANHHMRSPENMGRIEVLDYLIHMVEDQRTSLATFRAARTALRALYKVSLQRPQEVENIPNRPEGLRQLADALRAAPPTADTTPIPDPSHGITATATVS